MLVNLIKEKLSIFHSPAMLLMSPFVHAQEPRGIGCTLRSAPQLLRISHADSVPMKKPIQRLIIIRSVLKKVIQGWNS